MEITECPQCGATTKPSQRKCEYCKAEFFVTNLAYLGNFSGNAVSKYLKYYKELTKHESNNEEGLLGLGLCYLQMGTYPLAEKCFEKIIDISPDISQAYYYYCLSNIKGRRIKTISLNEARRLVTYLQTAIQLDETLPQYKILLAMIKRDYYETNGMKVSPPSSNQLIEEVNGIPINQTEIDRLKECTKVANQEIFFNNITITSA